MQRTFFVWIGLVWCSVWCSAASANTHYLVTQSTESDCGPAALATLLRFYLDVPATEGEMVRLAKRNQQTGTTLLGLEQAATAKGCAADSFRMSYDTLQAQLTTYHTPVIVRTLNPEPHFSLVLAVEKDHVAIADPAAGNILLDRRAFLRRWLLSPVDEGFVLVVVAPNERVNQEHRQQVVRELERQLANLENMRPQPAPWRR